MKKSFKITLSVLAVAAVAAGCATGSSSVDLDKLTAQIVKASFRDQGIVKASVLDTDETNRPAVRQMLPANHWMKPKPKPLRQPI
jgi:sulfur-oxidizing protein SoxX